MTICYNNFNGTEDMSYGEFLAMKDTLLCWITVCQNDYARTGSPLFLCLADQARSLVTNIRYSSDDY